MDSKGSQTINAMLSLRSLVLTGELVPGQRVMETWVVRQTGASRTPVREAMARLCNERLLERLPRGGFVVRTLTQQDALDAIEVRGVLEGLAARRAAEHGVHPRVLREMRRQLSAIDSIILAKGGMRRKDLKAYGALNERFHRLIAQACGGQTVPWELERLSGTPFAHPSAFALAEQQAPSVASLRRAQEQHWLALEALETRQARWADQIMRDHAQLAADDLRLSFRHVERSAAGDHIHLMGVAAPHLARSATSDGFFGPAIAD